MRPPTFEQLTAECSRWNAAHRVGTPVNVKMDNGATVQTTTRSEASILSGHTAVIWLEGISGCYLLSRVTPREANA